jgi:hypothetical protein
LIINDFLSLSIKGCHAWGDVEGDSGM